ncbi:hypothetical protein JCM3765_002347 [Sporobolomyces pararoseus]
MTSVSNQSHRPSSIAVPGGGSSIRPSTKRSIKNPFRRQQSPPSSIQASSPPAYSTLASDKQSTAPSKKATSLFSWKSGGSKMSWVGFSSLRGKSSTQKEEVHPELPSSADRLKSTWKRRQNRHGVLEFEFQPPFIVELDNSLPPQTREQVRLGSLAVSPSPIPPRSTFTPSPVPPVSPRDPRTRELPSPVPSSASSSSHSTLVPRPATTTAAGSRLPRISETSQLRQPSRLPQPSPSLSNSADPSPDLAKHTFSDKFPLPPVRRPSSAELVVSPTPARTLLSPPRNVSSPPPNRFTSSNLPRPKNGPYTASNPYPPSLTAASRLPTPSSPSPRSTPQQPSLRKPISIPAKPRTSLASSSTASSSPRLTAITNNAIAVAAAAVAGSNEGTSRTSWDSFSTVTRSSSASGASEDTIIASDGNSPPFSDLKKRGTPITVGTVPTLRETATGGLGAKRRESLRSESEKLRAGETFSHEEKRGWEKEVEEMFSEERMKDLLIQLGI